MAAMLQRAGFRDVLVDWGGDVKVLGLVRVRVRVRVRVLTLTLTPTLTLT